MDITRPMVAGMIATTLFALSTLPMVLKAHRTKDLKSYSLGYLLLGNAGNLFYSIYVFNMPPGPIWLLHSFYLITTGMMLFWYLCYEWWPAAQRRVHHKDIRSARQSQPSSRRQVPVHEQQYPHEIPRSGHDGSFLLPYTGSVTSHIAKVDKVRNIMTEQNKALVRRIFEEIENRGNMAAADQIFARDFVNHLPFGEMHGIEGAKQFASMLRTAFPDLNTTVEHQIAEGDRVASRWIARGTQKGEFQGVPATGRQMKITGITISRIANGKIVEQWGNPDLFSMMQQLGVIPEPNPR